MTRFRKWEGGVLAKVRALPDSPGVYQMKDKAGAILYIGKALSLRARVSSYFTRAKKHGENIEMMLSRLEDFEVLLTPTEAEAFVLEASLVKQFQPPYNILLKDDKSYPYIKITTNEAYPRLFVTRNVKDDGASYFGPYTSVGAMRRALKFIANLFNLRTCSLEIDGEKFIPKPCLDYHLKICSGPCADLISREEYGELTKQAIRFFSGSEEEVRKNIGERMNKASKDRRYEAAGRLRDVLFAVKRAEERRSIWGERRDFYDALGFARSEKQAIVMVIPVRAGRVLGEIEYTMENKLEEEPAEILSAFVQQYYSNPQHIQPLILLPEELSTAGLAAEWLSGLLGRKVKLTLPKRGRKAKLVKMAMENAEERLKTRLIGREGEFVVTPGVSRIREIMRLPFLPRRIEGYDISHLRGKETVGSMVVFTDGKPDKKAYRSFTIRTKARGDDLLAMKEMLARRLTRFLSDDSWYEPDTLLLIDGGRTQLDAVLGVIKDLRLEYPAGLSHHGPLDAVEDGDPNGDTETIDEEGGIGARSDSKKVVLGKSEVKIEEHSLDSLAVAALKKSNEALVHYDARGNLLEHHLDLKDPGLSLLIAVRDESHRRAQRHHHARRDKSTKKSSLEGIPGVGPKRGRLLLKKYKSLKRIREANADELARVPGMTREAAVNVKKYLIEAEGDLARKWRMSREAKKVRRRPPL